ncbi:hypothetical protein, partial [Bartonella melophagi]|uniref:hypothetical protein n=1 Tax=Bartonella melophagi TaxID=291176 RepID=UPI001AEBA678
KENNQLDFIFIRVCGFHNKSSKMETLNNLFSHQNMSSFIDSKEAQKFLINKSGVLAFKSLKS